MTQTTNDMHNGRGDEMTDDLTNANDDADEPAADAPGGAARHKALTVLMRHISTTMQLWAFCRHSGCHRTRECRGEPRDCLARYAQLVPDEVRDWYKAMLAGQKDDRDFDEVRAENEDAFDAMIAWRQLIEHAFQPPAGK
jgi:hypothetical protein